MFLIPGGNTSAIVKYAIKCMFVVFVINDIIAGFILLTRAGFKTTLYCTPPLC